MKNRANSRGYALVAALSVLALFAIFAMAAGDSTEFTWMFNHARSSDQRLGDVLEAVAVGVPPAQLITSASDVPTSGPEKPVFELEPGAKDNVLVWARSPEAKPDTSYVAPMAGDALVQLEAASVRKQATRRAAIYLLNASGQRPAPILIEEKRIGYK